MTDQLGAHPAVAVPDDVRRAQFEIGAALRHAAQQLDEAARREKVADRALVHSRVAQRCHDAATTFDTLLATPSAQQTPVPAAASGVGLRGIYIASKTTHAARWRALRADGYSIISTWIDEAGVGETASFPDLWRRCVSEASGAKASGAKAVVVYREPGEILKGAFVEVGAALSVGKPVFAVGCDEFSFVHHSLVTRCATLEDALAVASLRPDPATPGPGAGDEFRVGRKVPRNIYRGDEPICMVATGALAHELVGLLNATRPVQPAATPGASEGLREAAAKLLRDFSSLETVCAQQDADVPDKEPLWVLVDRRRQEIATYGDLRNLDRALRAAIASASEQGVGLRLTGQEALQNCAEAVAFFDQVKASSDEEKAAVGADHWNWLESACRQAAEAIAAPAPSHEEA